MVWRFGLVEATLIIVPLKFCVNYCNISLVMKHKRETQLFWPGERNPISKERAYLSHLLGAKNTDLVPLREFRLEKSWYLLEVFRFNCRSCRITLKHVNASQ